MLIFETVKHVTNRFHSVTPTFLPAALRLADYEISLFEGELSGSFPMHEALNRSLTLMADHTRRETAAPLWGELLAYGEEVIKAWAKVWYERERECVCDYLFMQTLNISLSILLYLFTDCPVLDAANGSFSLFCTVLYHSVGEASQGKSH